jgi:hypothetical protein
MTENNTNERAFDWDDVISADSSGGDYVTLPDGDYEFTVVGFEREIFSPGPNAKLPAGTKVAVMELHFEGFAPDQTIKERLFLHTRTEGILCAFFTSIGQRKHGESLRPDWKSVIGSKGRAKLGIREYEKDGEKRTINQVKRWLEPSDAASSSSPAPGAF